MIHSSSDGSIVDTEPPHIVITTLGLYGIDTENGTLDDESNLLERLQQSEAVYQTQYDSIDLRWNVTDETSDVANVTWMAGALPLMDDRHGETDTNDDQVGKGIMFV